MISQILVHRGSRSSELKCAIISRSVISPSSDPLLQMAKIPTFSLNILPGEQTKAALRGIKVVPTNSYAWGEERPYGNTVYTRTDGISATGTARSDRAI